MSVSEGARYHSVAILLHWVMALAIIGMIVIGFVMGDVSPLARKIAVYQFHKSLGLTVLALSIVRLGWRLLHRAPALPAHMPAWEVFGARASHVLLYVLMIGLPLSGWYIISTSSNTMPTQYFGLFTVPLLPVFGDKKGAHELSEELHELLAFGAIALVTLHVLAALKHHFIDRDDVLKRMLPRFSRS